MKIIKYAKDSILSDDKKYNKKYLLSHHIKILYYITLFYIINLTNEDISISKIKLTLKGTGKQKILASISKSPDDIFVNNVPQEKKGKFVYNLSEQINNITIIWNSQITNCQSMFYNLSNITYIDLSDFDTSKVNDMGSM